MNTGRLIAERRKELGLSQGQLADRAATSRERISTYEREQVYPQADTLERVLGAMHAELSTTPTLTYEERRSLAISSAVAQRLLQDPGAVLSRARANIALMRSVADHEHRWLDIWEALLDIGQFHIVALLTSKEQFARDLRQSSPFAGVLTQVERADAVSGVVR